MSSDVDDELVLPDSLQKLEIVPIYSQLNSVCKATAANNQNPFFATTNRNDLMVNDDDSIVKLFGPTCSNCGGSTDNGNNGSKDTSSKSGRHSKRENSVNHSTCSYGGNSIEHGIQKQIHFKQRDKEKLNALSEKKLLILREPILKSIGRSMYHKNNCSKSCCIATAAGLLPDDHISVDDDLASNNSINSNNLSNLAANKCSSVQNGHGKCSACNGKQNWQLRNVNSIDFKSLVNDCSNLSLTSSTNLAAIDNDSALHKTKSFQTFQTTALASSSAISDMNYVNNSNSNSNAMNSSVSSISSNSSSSSSSSCSQQARMNSSNCDVTIDELASYFETFVHIPKKMSSMAEMMYI